MAAAAAALSVIVLVVHIFIAPGTALIAAAGAAARSRAAALAAALVVLVAHAAGAARFFGREFVRRAFLMRRATAFAGDFALLIRVHRSETALAGVALLAALAGALIAALVSALTAALLVFIAALIRCCHVVLLSRCRNSGPADGALITLPRQSPGERAAMVGQPKDLAYRTFAAIFVGPVRLPVSRCNQVSLTFHRPLSPHRKHRVAGANAPPPPPPLRGAAPGPPTTPTEYAPKRSGGL